MQHINAIYLPKFDKAKPLYIGFFNTGAYQENIGGFGGLQHCLIPNPKHILIDLDENGRINTRLFRHQQTKEVYRCVFYVQWLRNIGITKRIEALLP